VLLEELEQAGVRPHDAVADLKAEGLEVVRSGWRDPPGSLARQPTASRPPFEPTLVGDEEAKSAALRVAKHMRACRPAYETYVPCIEPAKLRALGVPFGTLPGQVEVSGITTDDFVVTGRSSPGRRFELATNDLGPALRTCRPKGRGRCPPSGRW
jgi:hypothetical protein